MSGGSRNTRTRGWRRQAWKNVISYDKAALKPGWVRGIDEYGTYIQDPKGKRRKYYIKDMP